MRFLIVEDQTILRNLLCPALEATFSGCSTRQASTLAEARDLLTGKNQFDVAIVDLDLPDGNALDLLAEMVRQPGSPKFIVLSSAKEDYILYRALHANLHGFVHKSDNTSLLALAINTVMANGVFFSPTVQAMRTKMQSDPMFFQKILSVKEQEILKYIGLGMPNSEVAELLGMKEATVADHRRNIMNKLDIHEQGELMKYAIATGFSRIK